MKAFRQSLGRNLVDDYENPFHLSEVLCQNEKKYMNVVSTHIVNPSITEFIESESEKVLIDPCSIRVTMKEPAFRANSMRASSVAYIFFGLIVLVFYIRDVCSAKTYVDGF